MKEIFEFLVGAVITAIYFLFLLMSPCFANEPATVIKVIDGDTMLVNYKEKDEEIRLIGIDCYETSPCHRAYKQAYTEGVAVEKIIEMGKLSKIYVETLVKPNDIVKLEFQKEKRDRYDRLLAYVYLKNGKMLNKLILENNQAKLYLYKGTKHKFELYEAVKN